MGGGIWCAEPITSSCFRPPPLPTAASFLRRRSSIMGPTCSSSSSSSSTSSPTVSSKSSPDIVRHWVQPQLPRPSPTLSSQERFKVMSYNILGDKNATKHSDMYDHVPSAYMTWAHRKTVICEELMGWNPDLICLQEVDKYHDLSSTLEKAGFLGSYKRRSGDIVDGCAMFWKADKFRLLDTEAIEFKRYGLRDNVAQLSVFEVWKLSVFHIKSALEGRRRRCLKSLNTICRQMIEAESRKLVVGNIHVLYRPSRGEIKVAQVRLLTSRAQILSRKWGDAPIVLAGDYNSTPQSAIYKFLSTSKLNIALHKRRDLSGQRDCHPAQVLGVKTARGAWLDLLESAFRFSKYSWTDEEVRVATGSSEGQVATHPLKLKSAYATLKGSSRTRESNGEPLATSYHLKFLGTVDYLWYTDGLAPTRVLDTLPIDILQSTRGLPTKKLGSDHLALVSEFTFIENTKNDNTCNESLETIPDVQEDSCR